MTEQTNQPAQEPASGSASIGFGTMLAIALMGAILGLGGSYYLFTTLEARLNRLQQESPPVVVVDIPAIVARFPQDISTEETDALMRRTKATIDRLKQAGYMVLDADSVLAGPEGLYVPTDMFFEE